MVTTPSAPAHDFDTAVLRHAFGSIVGCLGHPLTVTPHRGDAGAHRAGHAGDRVGAALREAHVVFIRGAAVGMADDRVGDRVGAAEELLQMGAARGTDAGAVGREILIGFDGAAEIDLVADRAAIAGHMGRHVAFGAVIHHPVFTAIGIDPDGRDILLALDGALLRDPAVLMLDEPTSALDPASAELVEEALRWASAKRSVVLITHKPSQAALCDRIIVLENGRVAEEGTPAQLMSQQGRYWAMMQPVENGQEGSADRVIGSDEGMGR